MKQKHYIAGLYFRLSQEDERQGESVSIDNQRSMLRKYAEEHSVWVFRTHTLYLCLLLPLPIVSIKIGYNDRQKYSGNQGIHQRSIKER